MSQLGDSLNIVTLESDALKDLVRKLMVELQPEPDPWIDEKEAMHLLRISSKTTFQKYRDMGKIDFRRMSQRHIIYRRQSILDFIESFGQEQKNEDNG